MPYFASKKGSIVTRFPFSMPYNTKEGRPNTVLPSKNMQKIILFVVFLLGIQTLAQDKPNPPPKAKIGPAKPIKPSQPSKSSKPEPNPNLRYVDGQLYDRTKSVRWTTFDGSVICRHLDGVIFSGDRLEYSRVYQPSVYGPGLHSPMGSMGLYTTRGEAVLASGSYVTVPRKIPAGKIFVRNYPTVPGPSAGPKTTIRVMHIGSTDYRGETIKAYDFGTLDP